jgi:hypothetical protein
VTVRTDSLPAVPDLGNLKTGKPKTESTIQTSSFPPHCENSLGSLAEICWFPLGFPWFFAGFRMFFGAKRFI